MTQQKPPKNPKIYHIVHMDRLESILKEDYLWSDAKFQEKQFSGTTIGITHIKNQRLQKTLNSYPNLHVGDCVPFYFCPRSVMLYMFFKNNHLDISYHGGQEPIVHLQADFYQTVKWSEQNLKKWVFTNCNAGSQNCHDFNELSKLNKVNWGSVDAMDWENCREAKQAEFLLEEKFPWSLVKVIGVYSEVECKQVNEVLLDGTTHRPPIKICSDWYY